MRERVPSALGGQRVDRVVAMLTTVSRREASALVQSGAVRVDDHVVTVTSTRVAPGQTIEVELADDVARPQLVADSTVGFEVLHADEAVIVVDKPAGLVVHPGAGHHEGTLVQGLLAGFPELAAVGEPNRPGIVHRLDKGTSGLLVVARTEQAYRSLIEQFAAHRAERVYLALVSGVPDAAAGIVDAPLGRSRRDPTRMAVRAEGKQARTRYRVLNAFHHPAPAALVECTLETGRTHQVRVHLSAIGHPVIGDLQYRGARRRLAAPRPMLHAARLSFDHPTHGGRVSFSAPVPADMAGFVATLER